jgi:hypothetical protein
MNNLPLETTPFDTILHSVYNSANVVAMRGCEVPTGLPLFSVRSSKSVSHLPLWKACTLSDVAYYLFTNRDSLRIYLWLYNHLLDLGRFYSFFNLYTVGRTPWMGDQPVSRSLPTHRTAQTQNKRTQTSIIHASSGIRTHDASVWAGEHSLCLRPRDHCDRRLRIRLDILLLLQLNQNC